jgi:GNAT superfamily N-acetyltransferase
LVGACEAWAADAGFERVRLRSGVHRDDAHAFYRRIGFEQSRASYAFERSLVPARANAPAATAAGRMPVAISPIEPADRDRWEVLARGYKQFYETRIPDEEYERAWQRLRTGAAHALGARIDGRLVGIAHFLYHASTWADRVCYLQDLFVDPEARGHGVARALIEAVAERARADGASRYYWLTQRHNLVARALYDRVAVHRGFIRYDHPLDGPG